MKNGKKPTLRQKMVMREHGLVPENWLVVKDLGSELQVVSRKALEKKSGKARIRRLGLVG